MNSKSRPVELPRLTTRFDIFAWYDDVRQSGMPVAWCSAFAPAEVLLAAGVMPVYPENHAAMLGALSPTRDPQAPYASDAIRRSRTQGHDFPRLCSYAQADIGVLLGADSPLGCLPPPDLFYACNSQCSVVERWGDDVQRRCAEDGRDVPHYVLRAPPLTRAERHSPAQLAGFRQQIEDHVADICRRFGTTFSSARLAAVTAESAEANRLWQQCLELARERPAPWSMTDAFQAMAPIVIARGTRACTDFYRCLLAELHQRQRDGVAFCPSETVRLLWDAIPIWPRKNWLARFCAERDAVFVTSTYTHSWWFTFPLADPMAEIVERYAWNTMNRSGRWVLDWTLGLVDDYAVDGIVAHWNHSCGIWNSYVKRRLPGYREAGVPHVVLEADMVDADHFDEERVAAQLDAFISDLTERRRSAVAG